VQAKAVPGAVRHADRERLLRAERGEDVVGAVAVEIADGDPVRDRRVHAQFAERREQTGAVPERRDGVAELRSEQRVDGSVTVDVAHLDRHRERRGRQRRRIDESTRSVAEQDDGLVELTDPDDVVVPVPIDVRERERMRVERVRRGRRRRGEDSVPVVRVELEHRRDGAGEDLRGAISVEVARRDRRDRARDRVRENRAGESESGLREGDVQREVANDDQVGAAVRVQIGAMQLRHRRRRRCTEREGAEHGEGRAAEIADDRHLVGERVSDHGVGAAVRVEITDVEEVWSVDRRGRRDEGRTRDLELARSVPDEREELASLRIQHHGVEIAVEVDVGDFDGIRALTEEHAATGELAPGPRSVRDTQRYRDSDDEPHTHPRVRRWAQLDRDSRVGQAGIRGIPLPGRLAGRSVAPGERAHPHARDMGFGLALARSHRMTMRSPFVDEKPVAVDSGCRNCASSSSGGNPFGIAPAS
jgi:hypothetical protein